MWVDFLLSLSVGQDEYASGCFDLFKGVEIENSIADVTRIVTRPISVASRRGPFIFEIPADPAKFLSYSHSPMKSKDFMGE